MRIDTRVVNVYSSIRVPTYNLGRRSRAALAANSDVNTYNPESPIEDLLDRGDALYDAGRLVDARDLYRDICELHPQSDDAWFMDGLISLELGDSEHAATSLDRALAVNPSHVEALSLTASIQLAAGDVRSAMDLSRRCLAIDPDYAEAWTLLGGAQGAAGSYNDAIASCDHALEIRPHLLEATLTKVRALESLGRFSEAVGVLSAAEDTAGDRPDIYETKGQLLLRLSRFSEAAAAFSKVVELDSDCAAAFEGLGTVCLRLGDFAGAEHYLRDVLRRDAARPEAHISLGMLLRGKGNLPDALRHLEAAATLDVDNLSIQIALCLIHYELGEFSKAIHYCLRVLERNAENLAMRQVLPSLLQDLNGSPKTRAKISDELVRSFNMRGVDYETLARPAIRLLENDHNLNDAYLSLASKGAAYIDGSIRSGSFARLFGDGLFNNVLRYTTICDVKLNHLLTAFRSVYLNSVLCEEAPDWLTADDYTFPVSLACQFFHTEYSSADGVGEAELISRLEALIAAKCWVSERLHPVFLLRVIVYAMYRPLHGISCADWIEDRLHEPGIESLDLLVKRQLNDIREEARLLKHIRTSTRVQSTHSRKVEAEYDSSPYPRWLSAGTYTPESCRQIFSRRYAGYKDSGAVPHPLNVLVAGCGTGRHAVLAASRFTDARVLAVDLSAVSLAYGRRMAEELDVSNVIFEHADILELPSVGRKFHVIEAGGVLHNMEDPGGTLSIFANLLEDNGLLYLAAYRKAARQPVLEARALVQQQGLPSTREGIRQARSLIIEMASSRSDFAKMIRWRDFFTLSEARYLLFDVPEHTFELEELCAMIDSNGLRLLGFDLDGPRDIQRYRTQYPDDPSIANLQNMTTFEKDFPSAFGGQYRCWCQKI